MLISFVALVIAIFRLTGFAGGPIVLLHICHLLPFFFVGGCSISMVVSSALFLW